MDVSVLPRTGNLSAAWGRHKAFKERGNMSLTPLCMERFKMGFPACLLLVAMPGALPTWAAAPGCSGRLHPHC